MLFTDRKYARLIVSPYTTDTAAALLDRRDARKIRRRPELAAVIKAERLLLARMYWTGAHL